MRVYIPATWPMLRKLAANDRFDPVGGTAFALTPRLRESYLSGDEEELEYAALSEAARASLRLLAVEFGLGEDTTPARRVVVATRDIPEQGRIEASAVTTASISEDAIPQTRTWHAW